MNSLFKSTGFFLAFFAASLFAEQKRSTRLPEAKQAVGKVVRSAAGTSGSRFTFGPVLEFNGLFGKSSSSDVLAKGLGFAGGITGRVRVAERVRAQLTPTYKILRLGRAFDGSGRLQEPSPATLDQTVKGVGISLLGSYELERGRDPSSPVWWVDGGGEFILPLSAEQTLAGASQSFTAGKSLLALLGFSMDLTLSPSFELAASLHGFYNLAGSSEGKYFGARVLAGLTFKI